jgi:hypothetical protein
LAGVAANSASGVQRGGSVLPRFFPSTYDCVAVRLDAVLPLVRFPAAVDATKSLRNVQEWAWAAPLTSLVEWFLIPVESIG